MKSPAHVPSEVVKDIKEALMAPGQNYGKDSYTIDLTGTEATYCMIVVVGRVLCACVIE